MQNNSVSDWDAGLVARGLMGLGCCCGRRRAERLHLALLSAVSAAAGIAVVARATAEDWGRRRRGGCPPRRCHGGWVNSSPVPLNPQRCQRCWAVRRLVLPGFQAARCLVVRRAAWRVAAAGGAACSIDILERQVNYAHGHHYVRYVARLLFLVTSRQHLPQLHPVGSDLAENPAAGSVAGVPRRLAPADLHHPPEIGRRLHQPATATQSPYPAYISNVGPLFPLILKVALNFFVTIIHVS
nr:uncharacterized protein LOC127347777 [Lolium perenne]